MHFQSVPKSMTLGDNERSLHIQLYKTFFEAHHANKKNDDRPTVYVAKMQSKDP